MANMADTCSSCRYFDMESPDASDGRCRRYPPVMLKWPGGPVMTADHPVLPVTQPECGEWKDLQD